LQEAHFSRFFNGAAKALFRRRRNRTSHEIIERHSPTNELHSCTPIRSLFAPSATRSRRRGQGGAFHASSISVDQRYERSIEAAKIARLRHNLDLTPYRDQKDLSTLPRRVSKQDRRATGGAILANRGAQRRDSAAGTLASLSDFSCGYHGQA
jgi:hypothetical protein